MDVTEGMDSSVLSIWLGVCMGGLPEAVLIGLLALQHHMSVPFIASVFVANFPVRLRPPSAWCMPVPSTAFYVWSFIHPSKP